VADSPLIASSALLNTALRLRDPQYRDVYSNGSSISISPFDVSIIFQKMSEVSPGQPGLVDQVGVTLSPQQFKALVRSLSETLKAFEESFGGLTIPESDTRPTKTADEISKSIAEARKRAEETRSNLSSSEPLPPPEQSPASRRKKGN